VSGNLEKTKLCESCDGNLEEAGEEEQVSDSHEKARLNGTFNLAILKRMVKRNMLVALLKRSTIVEHVIGNLEVAGEEEHVIGNLKKAKLSETCDLQS